MAIGVLDPGGTDIWSTIVQYDVGFPIFEFAAEEVAAVSSGDIGSEGRDAGDGLYWNQIDT